MMTVGHSKRATQDHVIALFREQLGYHFLGDWTDRTGLCALRYGHSNRRAGEKAR